MAPRRIVLGRVSGLFGIAGRIKVYSYTRPPDNLLAYRQWWLGREPDWRLFRVLEARWQGKTLVARLGGAHSEALSDRDAAAALIDMDIAVARETMPDPRPGQYYWFDLVGLDVVNRDGVALGRVQALMETGGHDVLVVAGARERLIPFVREAIIDRVDFDARRIVADWQPDF